jgi:acetyl esterase/lipase
VYPVATFAPEGDAAVSVEQFADAKPLNAPMLEWFGSHYLSNPAEANGPMVSPLNAADLSGLPPATVILAEIDPLQSQGAVFAQALIDAGVDTTFTLYQGVTHEFFGMGAVVDKAAEAVAEAAARLKASFGS